MLASHICQSAFVALASVNLERQVEFYQAFLAIAPSLNTPTYAEFQLPGLRLAIFQPKEDHSLEFVATTSETIISETITSGTMSICIEVSSLDEAIARLKSLGYSPPGKILHASHGKEIYAYDPDGNRLILHQGR